MVSVHRPTHVIMTWCSHLSHIGSIEDCLLLTHPTHDLMTDSKDGNGNAIMAEILQEVKSIKVNIHGLARAQGQPWAKVTRKPEAIGATIRICLT